MNTTTFARKSHVAAVSIFVIGLAYSLFLHRKLGMDSFWDTVNYHIFIGWAASIFSPYSFGAVSQYHTFLNPLLDVVNYKLFSLHPYVGAAFHSLALAVTVLVLHGIALQVCKGPGLGMSLLRFWAIAIGASAAMVVSLFGSFTNEHLTGLMLLFAFWLLLRYLEQADRRLILAAGLVAGMALGLKLTAMPFFLALFITTLLLTKFDRKVILTAVLAATVGLLLTEGWYMLLRWQGTGNPVFPLANNIFKSPFYPPDWKSFEPFEAAKLLSYLLLPVTWLSSGTFSEATTVRDGRFLLAYAGLAMLAFAVLVQRKKLDRAEQATLLFFVLSWLLWIVIFRIYRYLVVLELLSGLVFLMGLQRIVPAGLAGRQAVAAVAAVMLLASAFLSYVTVYPDWGRRPWSAVFVQTDLPKQAIAQDGVVYFADYRLAYMAPELHARGIRFANLFSQPWYDGDTRGSPRDHVPTPELDIRKAYFLQYVRTAPGIESAILKKAAGDAPFTCVDVKSNMNSPPLLCRYEMPN